MNKIILTDTLISNLKKYCDKLDKFKLTFDEITSIIDSTEPVIVKVDMDNNNHEAVSDSDYFIPFEYPLIDAEEISLNSNDNIKKAIKERKLYVYGLVDSDHPYCTITEIQKTGCYVKICDTLHGLDLNKKLNDDRYSVKIQPRFNRRSLFDLATSDNISFGIIIGLKEVCDE